MRKTASIKVYLLLGCMLLLASCSKGSETVIMPAAYSRIDAGTLPPVLQEFLGRYDSFDAMNASIQKDYKFIAREVNNRPAGSRDSSPLVALSEDISDLLRDSGHKRAPWQKTGL